MKDRKKKKKTLIFYKLSSKWEGIHIYSAIVVAQTMLDLGFGFGSHMMGWPDPIK